MNRPLGVFLTLVVFSLGEIVGAQPAVPGGSGAPPPPPGLAPVPPAASGAPKATPAKKRRRRRGGEARSPVETTKKVWSETDSARIKSIYDEQGNLIYQKAWDKGSGREVPVPDGPAPTAEPRERAADLDLTQPSEARPYGRLRPDSDGEYGEQHYDPRPRYREHSLHAYPRRQRRHPYEFSLALGFWSNALSGKLTGPGGSGTGQITRDKRSTYEVDIMNPRAGFAVVQMKHTAGVNGTFTFRGISFSGAIFDQDFVIYESFFRFPLYANPDLFIDWKIGLELITVRASVTGAGNVSSVNTLVPLPLLGLMGRLDLLDNIHIRGYVRGFAAGTSKASATTLNSELEAVYTFPADHEYSRFNQFSIGFKFVGLSVTTDKGGANQSSSDLTFSGPFAKFSAYF